MKQRDRTDQGPSLLVGHRSAHLERLLGRRPLAAIKWGLERTESMLESLGRPQDSFRAVHVGGTNGKGSTAAMVSSVLQETGHRTGLYTSPQLRDFRERIRIAGAPVERGLLEACALRLQPLAEEVEATFFEAATALAFLVFREAGVEYAAVEVGLGGRLDATNVLLPETTVVTSVARDHAEYLGDTLEEIAGEKAGIFKEGVSAVLGPVPGPVEEVFADRADRLGSELRVLGRDATLEDVEVGLEGTAFRYRSPRHPGGIRLRVPLVGEHQAVNASLAVMALERLPGEVPPGVLDRGLRRVRWRGRFEPVRRDDGLWIVDVAHNHAGIEVMCRTLRATEPPEPHVLVLGVLGDKAWGPMLETGLQHATAAVLTLPPTSPPERRWDPWKAREGVTDGRVEVRPEFGRALERARELAGGGTVVVAGSCYTAGDALQWLESSASPASPTER